MASALGMVPVASSINGLVVKWFKKARSSVRKGDRMCSVQDALSGETRFVQSQISGEVEELCVAEGAQVVAGEVLARMSPCVHPAVYNSMCVSCGEKVTVAPSSSVSSLTLSGGGQQLHVSKQEAERVQESKLVDLQRRKKLALILDLDHTLVHATEITGPPRSLAEGVSLLVLEDPPASAAAAAAVGAKHHLLAKRPHLDWFLQEANKICQLTIYTAATRRYAEAVAKIIDPTGKLFTGRMVSRSDVKNDKSGCLEKSLQRLFLGDASMAVIIDDRCDVWRGEQENQLLLVRPFHFFKEGREINNAAGPMSAVGAAQAPQVEGPLISLAGPSPGMFMASDNNQDDQLLRCLDLLQTLHAQYFDSMQPGKTPLPMGRLLTDLKSSVLLGCVIAFSGIIPTNEKEPHNHPLWRLAVSLGAQVTLSVHPRTTHLISIQAQTQKVLQCLQRGDIWVIHPDWLFYCRWSVAKVVENTFMITALAPGRELPNPTLDASPVLEEAPQGLPSASHASSDDLALLLPGAEDAQQHGVRGTKRAFGAMSAEKQLASTTAHADGHLDEEGENEEEDESDDGFGEGFDDSI